MPEALVGAGPFLRKQDDWDCWCSSHICEHHLSGVHIAFRWMEKEYGHHVAQSLPQESDTGASAKKIMEEGNLQQYTLQEVSHFGLYPRFVAKFLSLVLIDYSLSAAQCVGLLAGCRVTSCEKTATRKDAKNRFHISTLLQISVVKS